MNYDIYYVFEDNPDTPISKLLKKLLCDKVVFAKRNNRVVREMAKIKRNNPDSIIVGFIDYPAGNYEAETCYYKAISLLKQGEADDSLVTGGARGLFLFPIVCIEFVVIEMLSFFNYDTNLYNSLKDRSEFLKKSCSSLENYCKVLLSSTGVKYGNKSKYNQDMNNFYASSGIVEAARLFLMLPVFIDHEEQCRLSGVVSKNISRCSIIDVVVHHNELLHEYGQSLGLSFVNAKEYLPSISNIDLYTWNNKSEYVEDKKTRLPHNTQEMSTF